MNINSNKSIYLKNDELTKFISNALVFNSIEPSDLVYITITDKHLVFRYKNYQLTRCALENAVKFNKWEIEPCSLAIKVADILNFAEPINKAHIVKEERVTGCRYYIELNDYAIDANLVKDAPLVIKKPTNVMFKAKNFHFIKFCNELVKLGFSRLHFLTYKNKLVMVAKGLAVAIKEFDYEVTTPVSISTSSQWLSWIIKKGALASDVTFEYSLGYLHISCGEETMIVDTLASAITKSFLDKLMQSEAKGKSWKLSRDGILDEVRSLSKSETEVLDLKGDGEACYGKMTNLDIWKGVSYYSNKNENNTWLPKGVAFKITEGIMDALSVLIEGIVFSLHNIVYKGDDLEYLEVKPILNDAGSNVRIFLPRLDK